jgi:glucosamine--fructose-6-phosphate aminotransferase (isomerizing)
MSQLFQEINEQPDALARFLNEEPANVRRIAQKLAGVNYVTIAARGTSDNAATYAKYLFAAFNGLNVALASPSLYTLYKRPPRLSGSLVIGISQSGESTDIVAVMEEGRRQGAPTLAITNFADSALAHTAEDTILLHAGEEKTIAATKTYTNSLAALALLSTALGADNARERELGSLQSAVSAALGAGVAVERIAARWKEIRACLVIGRGYNYATAFEIAQKIKELAYVIAEPYSSADFLHGPIAVIEDRLPVVFIAPSGVLYEDSLELMRRLKDRGADLVVISDAPAALQLSNAPIALPTALPEWLSPFTSVVAGQLLAYHLTCAKGIDPDHPRGLTKVTRTL